MTSAIEETNYYIVPFENNKHLLRGHFSLSDGGCCCIVAVVNPGIDWAAYIEAAPANLCEDDALRYVAQHGNKLCREDASRFFDALWMDPWWRSHYRR